MLVPDAIWVEELQYSIKKKQIKYKRLEISGLIVIFILSLLQTYFYTDLIYSVSDPHGKEIVYAVLILLQTLIHGIAVYLIYTSTKTSKKIAQTSGINDDGVMTSVNKTVSLNLCAAILLMIAYVIWIGGTIAANFVFE